MAEYRTLEKRVQGYYRNREYKAALLHNRKEADEKRANKILWKMKALGYCK